MDFLDKLNVLMQERGLNKSSLSKACNIPYTTIDGWYKKGFDDMRLSTLKKLSKYFNTSLDYWAYDNENDVQSENEIDRKIVSSLARLSDEKKSEALDYLTYLLFRETQE